MMPLRNDLYTKAVLNVIAVMLTLITCKSVVQPIGVAAEGRWQESSFRAGSEDLYGPTTRSRPICQYLPRIPKKTFNRNTKPPLGFLRRCLWRLFFAVTAALAQGTLSELTLRKRA